MKDKLLHILFKKRFSLPKAASIDEAVRRFTLTEKVIFYALATVLALSSLTALLTVSDAYSVEIPSRGGTLTEGVIGLPRFVNPLLALSDADRDLTALIYSGLLRATPEGRLVPDAAERYSISEDGLTYTFTLKSDVTFHDGKPLTADDVIFTIEKAQDPALKSPKRPNWEGVHAEKISAHEVRFTLKQAYAPFLENMTQGILPTHLWGTVPVEEFPFSRYNVEPIGSGPYRFKLTGKASGSVPLFYRLETFNRYTFGEPYIKTLIIRFYQNNRTLLDAYQNGSIDSMANITSEQADLLQKSGSRIERAPLPRIFGVFFNQNHAPLLANKEVRQALARTIDKRAVVNEILGGYGIAIESPIPPGLMPEKTDTGEPQTEETGDERVNAAKKILENAKWKWNEEKQVYEKMVKKDTVELTFSLSTSNAPELKNVAELLKTMWQKIGARVEVKIFDIGELNQNVIRTRKYDALLFGEIIGRDLDLFAFWHSSQRNDPGLNIALYTNAKADKALEEARVAANPETRYEKYTAFEQEVAKDIPAIFIYSPDFLYVVPQSLSGFALDRATIPAERFLGIENWYVETEKVWRIFTQ